MATALRHETGETMAPIFPHLSDDERHRRNQAAITLLDDWDQNGHEEEQRETMRVIREADPPPIIIGGWALRRVTFQVKCAANSTTFSSTVSEESGRTVMPRTNQQRASGRDSSCRIDFHKPRNPQEITMNLYFHITCSTNGCGHRYTVGDFQDLNKSID